MDPYDKTLSQKEYLKKYLSIGVKGGTKKKKKKPKPIAPENVKRSMVIDDDIDLSKIPCGDDDVINLDYLGDEAPQVVAIIDERPLMERPEGNMWKLLGENETVDSPKPGNESDVDVSRKGMELNSKGDSDASPPRKKRITEADSDSDVPVIRKREKRKGSESDEPKKGRKNRSYDRKVNSRHSREKHNYDSGISPARKSRNASDRGNGEDSASISRGPHCQDRSDSSDLSPLRKSKTGRDKRQKLKHRSREFDTDSDSSSSFHRSNNYNKRKRFDVSKKQDSDSDLSPPRHSTHKSKKRSETDLHSKSRRKDFDISLPSRSNGNIGSRQYDGSLNYRFKKGDIDSSPPQKEPQLRSEGSPHSRRIEREMKGKSDTSRYPPSSGRPRNGFLQKTRDRPSSSDSDLSPARRPAKQRKDVTKSSRSPDIQSKITKTLDGKKAGLQDAKHLKEELRHLKEKENKAFRAMDAHSSGKNAAPVVRDRKTGRVRDFHQEKMEEMKKAAKEAEHQKKYDRWGKGLKQIEDAQSQRADLLHEMSKPLARYADDEDLDKRLKEQEREGDPMLDYIRSKQREAITLEGEKPKYQGSFIPNRFGIPPGHRWDGVDRSNGYEKKWFEQQAARKARQEEAYKWSTSDM